MYLFNFVFRGNTENHSQASNVLRSELQKFLKSSFLSVASLNNVSLSGQVQGTCCSPSVMLFSVKP
jgi:hypothetical protein